MRIGAAPSSATAVSVSQLYGAERPVEPCEDGSHVAITCRASSISASASSFEPSNRGGGYAPSCAAIEQRDADRDLAQLAVAIRARSDPPDCSYSDDGGC